MALIIYPQPSWDTFASVEIADLIIGGSVVDAGVTAYLDLDETGKEQILRQTALQIKLCPSIVLPDDNTSDLELAQCYLVTHAISMDMIAYDPYDKAVTAESVDSLSVAYDASKKGSNADFPTMTQALLKQYGCSGQTSSFSQVFLGRN